MSRLGRRFVRHFNAAPGLVRPLGEQHAAVVDGRTLFPSTVVDPALSPRLLISGANQRKLGDRVVKGRWAGLPIYALTLEERATCPRSCHHWRTCYGNGMPYARRHRGGDHLVEELGHEIHVLARRHREQGGFVVRLHMLGDFYSVEYAALWGAWLHRYPGLHVFGFTAWPRASEIGNAVACLNDAFAGRCAIRYSVGALSGESMEATTVWQEPTSPRVGEAIVCPAQTDKTEACGTCGLCWQSSRPIAFIAHGRKGRGEGDAIARRERKETRPAGARQGRPRHVLAVEFGCGCEFIGLKAELPARCYRHGIREHARRVIGTDRDEAAMRRRTRAALLDAAD